MFVGWSQQTKISIKMYFPAQLVFQRRRGLRKVGGGWRGQKYYDPPSANSASNPAGTVQEGNLRVPSFNPSWGALPEHKHALEKWRKRRLLHRQRGRQRIRGVQQRGGWETYRGRSGWEPGGVGGETSAGNAPPIKPKWGLGPLNASVRALTAEYFHNLQKCRRKLQLLKSCN